MTGINKKFAVATEKIKKLDFLSHRSVRNIFTNLSSDTLKKTLLVMLVFGMGYSYNDINDAIHKRVHAAIHAMPPANANQPYNIQAPRQGLADSLAMALNDMRHINPFTRGCIEDIVANNQKFVIVPDSAMSARHSEYRANAYYCDDMIVLNESYIKKYSRMFTETGDAYIHDQRTSNQKSLKLFNTILHEARHAQQARCGLLLAKNIYYTSGDILNFVTTDAAIEADASQYSAFCMYHNGTSRVKQQNNSVRGDWDPTDYHVSDDQFLQAEIKDLNHLLTTNALRHFNKKIKTVPADTIGMHKFNMRFDKLTFPVAMQDGQLEYKSTESFYTTLRKSNVNTELDKVWGNAESYFSVLPYVHVLGIGENGPILDAEKRKESLQYAVEKLNKLRGDPNVALQYFEDELRRQRPDIFLSYDHGWQAQSNRDDR